MIRHYFKIAFRNLLKYKTQSIISIIGLAVGITCFALATLWIRYEMTYDTFHRRADDIYLVRAQLTITDGTLSNSMPYPAIEYLRKNISEIEDICGISPFKTNLRFKDKGGDLLAIEVDSAFIRMFDVRILQGNVNFLKKKSNEIAITEAVAKEWFGNESPLGKEIELGSRPCKVCAVVSGWSQHSNLSYGALLPARHHPSWQSNSEQIFVRILPDTDKSALQKRISSLDASSQEKESTLGKLNFTPITSLRYSDYLQKDEIVISFNYIRYFAMAGVLVIVCSLFNYLTLFVSRLRMRGRELGLRKVCGSTNPFVVRIAICRIPDCLASRFSAGHGFHRGLLTPFHRTGSDIRSYPAVYRSHHLHTGSHRFIFRYFTNSSILLQKPYVTE